MSSPGRVTILREWARVGCLGFGGPPTHIAMLRARVVERHGWLGEEEFEHAIAACNLLPGPASTQLAIFTAWRVGGVTGALIGGLAFIGPGLLVMIALAALFLAASPPEWVVGAGAGAGAAVAAVAVQAGYALVVPSWRRASGRRARWLVAVVLGAAAGALAGSSLVLVLLACGAAEVAIRPRSAAVSVAPVALLGAAPAVGGVGALAWVALKVGALSYGGGFVIIPLMQHDAVDTYGWMSHAQFLNAVALGQVTPGPVVHTVTAVGYAAAGLGGALLAAAVAFAPSFGLVLVGASRFERLRGSDAVQAFLAGAGAAAIGGILGSAIPLAAALGATWQYVVLAVATPVMVLLRVGVVLVLLLAAAAGVAAAALGLELPV